MKQTCPVCQGKETVHTGFYGTGHCSIKDLMDDKFRNTCRCCDGKGVIETIDPETLPIVQELKQQLAEVTKEMDAIIKDLKYYLETNEENGVVYIPKFTIEKMFREGNNHE